MDASNPTYFAIGVILIIIFYLSSINETKKNIDSGKGDEHRTTDYWGNENTNKQDYEGLKLSFTIFLLVLLYHILTN